MKVSGFTFVRNAVKYGYPVVESIQSILPLVDEMIVCLGDSDDSTNDLVASIRSPKIRMIHSTWDDSLREEGKVLAVETDKAMDAVASDSDWLFYIQADEVLHEKYHPAVLAALRQYCDVKRVEGLLFRYLHFYGSFRYIGDGRRWYSREIRVIRNNRHIRSYRDAQGFRWDNGRKLKVKPVDAYIHHYGWVREPATMLLKTYNFKKLWAGGNEEKSVPGRYDYARNIDSVTLFDGTHPAVMKEKVAAENWEFKVDSDKKNFKNLKHWFLYFLAKTTGWRLFEYRNYKKI